ncbi:hypothetical protein SCHPADRAFT_888243 [Schizopora paradoxa]|uniref:DUF1793-domain-containing protein n=1 Tax=Schizopora paradoxa TaxID=27342 RepID=A0A0H2RVE0_9AGAM|nr:hypothetical protein SCHPADRAFT_888243 [Schizopora paradoxa]
MRYDDVAILFATLISLFPLLSLSQNVVVNGPALPFAVKSPYLNTWIPGGGLAPHTVLFNPGPTIWSTAVPPLDWSCAVCFWSTTNADGSPDCGDGVVVMKEANATSNEPPLLLSNITSVVLTPTRTSYLIQAGAAELNVTFFTPITPTDLTRQSLPFSYLYITVTNPPDAPQGGGVRVYTDITAAQWLSGEDIAANASSIIDDELIVLISQLESPQQFVEIDERPQDGTVYYAAKAGSNVRYQVGQDIPVRTLATNSSGLQNVVDQSYGSRPLDDPQVDVFGISFDLDQPNDGDQGNGNGASPPLLWAVGLTRDPSIEFTSLNGSAQLRSSYFWSNFSTPRDAISFFLDDFDDALASANTFDAQILDSANKYSSEYADLVSLTARQVLSALEFTLPQDSSSSNSSEDVKVFVKDFDDLASGGVNAVDVLYAALPLFIYLNPDIVGMVLRPLLEAQDDPLYTLPYAAQNLGTKFPTATIQNSQHNLGIEQSGNMLIMTLAHAQAMGDGSIIGQHYFLLKIWAEYLVENSMNPGSQQTSIADGITSPNQTNLALKGILGIGAMARMSNFSGIPTDEARYQGISQSYMQQWLSLSVSSDKTHLLGNFGNETSSGVIYNLFADKLLQLGLVPQAINDMQSSFYGNQLTSRQFGLSLDSANPTLGRVDWTMLAASVVSNNDIQTQMISQVHAYAWNAAIRSGPLSTVYDPTAGTPRGGSNSPALGAIFSLLALESALQLFFIEILIQFASRMYRKPIQNVTVTVNLNPSSGQGTSGSSSPSSHGSHTAIGIIVGSVVGAFFAISPAVFFYFYRKRRAVKLRGNSHRHIQPLVSSGASTAGAPRLTTRHTESETAMTVMTNSETGSRTQLVSQPPVPAAAGIVYADTKASRVAHQLVLYGPDTHTDGLNESSSDPSRTTRSGSDSLQAVESPTENLNDNSIDNSYAYAYSDHDEMSPPTTHRTSSMSEVRRMRGQLSNLMREVARIRDERVPVVGVVVDDGSEALPMYEEARSRGD